MDKELREHRDVRRGAVQRTGIDAQRMSTSNCGYHRTGRNPTVQSVMMMLQKTKQRKSGPTLRNNKLLSKQQKKRRIGARMRCKTAARWVVRKTLETENATNSEHPEEWCTSQHWQGDVADDGNVTIIEPGDGRTADDEFSTRPRGCEKKLA